MEDGSILVQGVSGVPSREGQQLVISHMQDPQVLMSHQ